MKVDNWELKSSCDDTQFYYESKLNDDMIACIVIPHKVLIKLVLFYIVLYRIDLINGVMWNTKILLILSQYLLIL